MPSGSSERVNGELMNELTTVQDNVDGLDDIRTDAGFGDVAGYVEVKGICKRHF